MRLALATKSGIDVWINPDAIDAVESRNAGAYVHLRGGQHFLVTDTADEVADRAVGMGE